MAALTTPHSCERRTPRSRRSKRRWPRAAKTAEATESLGKEIADLKARLADERTEFALRSAGARSVTAAKALLAEHDGDVAALVKAEPWLFETKGSNQGGSTGLEPAGVAGGNAKEIMIPKISVTGLGDYTRNVGYKTGSIDFAYETKAFNYDRGIKLLADVMDVEEAGVLDCFVQAGAELQRTQVAPEADAFTYATIASHKGVAVEAADLSSAKATDVLAALLKVTNAMDEAQVTPGTRFLFITPTLKGVLDDYSLANPNMSNRVLTRFARIVEVPQACFYTKISLNSGDSEKFGYANATDGRAMGCPAVRNSRGIT